MSQSEYFDSWRYRDINSKEREAYHYMIRLEMQNKELNDRIKNVTFNYQGIGKRQRTIIDNMRLKIESACQTVELLFGGGAADEFKKSWDVKEDGM